MSTEAIVVLVWSLARTESPEIGPLRLLSRARSVLEHRIGLQENVEVEFNSSVAPTRAGFAGNSWSERRERVAPGAGAAV